MKKIFHHFVSSLYPNRLVLSIRRRDIPRNKAVPSFRGNTSTPLLNRLHQHLQPACVSSFVENGDQEKPLLAPDRPLPPPAPEHTPEKKAPSPSSVSHVAF
jgi:hypothetical protein